MFGLFKSRSKPCNPQLISFFKSKLNIRPRNWSVYEEALRHKSVASEKGLPNNERLEYLGDAVLDVIVAEYLFNNFTGEQEGILSQMKSRVVSRKNLGKVGLSLHLEQIVEFVDGPFINKKTICGNALEALIGALYLDLGFTKCTQFVHLLMSKHMDLDAILKENEDYKSQLLIWSQKLKKEVSFELINEEDFSHHKVYTFNVFCDGELIGSGQGRSKKKAEQVAALHALQDIQLGNSSL